MLDAKTVIRSLGGGRRSAGGWMCRYPAHNDKHASLKVTEGTFPKVQREPKVQRYNPPDPDPADPNAPPLDDSIADVGCS